MQSGRAGKLVRPDIARDNAPSNYLCLGVYGWRFDAATGKVASLGLAGETDSPSWVVVHPNKRFLFGAAPRHLAFAKNGKLLYVCYEAGRAASTYACDASKGALSPKDTVATLPPDARSTSASGFAHVAQS